MKRSLRALPLLLVVLAVVFSWPAMEGPDRDLNWWQALVSFFGRFFPPDFSDRAELWKGLLETAQIGVMATVIASILSFLFCLLGGPWVHPAGRAGVLSVLALVRSVPSLVWAVIAVAITGPFPRAGVLALTFYSIGYLGKFLMDDLRTLDITLMRLYLRWGVPPLWAFYYGFWPQLQKRYFAHCMWMLEYNIRSAAIIGYVGAGGLGLRLHAYQEYGQWSRFAAVLILILGVVLVFEVIARLPGWTKILRSQVRSV